MPAISKFMFDTAFDADPSAPRPAGSASPSSKVLLTKEELDSAKAKAFAEGEQAGAARAASEAAALLASAAQRLATQTAALTAQADRRHQEQMSDAVEIAVNAVRRLLPGLLEREGAREIEALFRGCLARLHEEPRLVVRVNDALLDHLRERLENIAAAAGFSGRLVLIADAMLAQGDARIEWADGGVERSPAAIQAEIASLIDRYLTETAGDPSDRQ